MPATRSCLAGGKVNGDATFTQVAGLVGTYYVRAIDQLGIASDFVERSTEGVRPVPFAQIISAGAFQPNDNVEDQVTIAEAPAWASTNPANTVDVDNINNLIKLLPKNRISGEALFSAIPLGQRSRKSRRCRGRGRLSFLHPPRACRRYPHAHRGRAR